MNPYRFSFSHSTDNFFLDRRILSRCQPRHEHLFYEILFIVSGERDFFIGDRIYHAEPGDLVMINPHTLHTAIENQNIDCECILIYLRDHFFQIGNIESYIQPLLEQEKIFFRLSLRDRENIHNLLLSSLSEYQSKEYGYQGIVQAYLTKFFILLVRIYLGRIEEEVQPQNPKEEKILSIIHYIKENYHRRLDLSETAEEFYISPPYLSRIFREVTNYGFIEYINSLRVSEAKKKLQKTDQKIIDIAADVGFGSVTHFGRVFREITGHQPRYYRKENNK